MAFRRFDLQEAFFVPGTYAFRVYGYGTPDPLEEVVAPGYFEHATGLLRPGELIYVSTRPPEVRGAATPGEPRMALVMVQADGRDPARAASTVRLVQDFGRPGDPTAAPVLAVHPRPDGAPAPIKRGRGRPPGARNKKPEPVIESATGS